MSFWRGELLSVLARLKQLQPLDARLTSWATVNRAAGFDAFAATPSSANFRTLLTTKTGTGNVVFSDQPTFTTAIISPLVTGGIGTGSSLSLKSTTSAAAVTDFINFLVGVSGATEAARFDTSGQLGIGTTAPTSKLTVSSNTATLPAAVSGTSVHIGGADAVQTRLLFDGFGSNGNFTFRAALGTAASRSALTTNTIIGSIAGFGAYDATNYTTTGRVTITYNAAENWSSTNQGTFIQLFTTANGTTSQRAVATFGQDGLLSLVGALGRGAPVTKTADFTVAVTENNLINNKVGSACTVTLPTASGVTGREITINNIQAQTVISASSNVVPKAGGAAGTAILAAAAGAWATLVSDGTNWKIMAGS